MKQPRLEERNPVDLSLGDLHCHTEKRVFVWLLIPIYRPWNDFCLPEGSQGTPRQTPEGPPHKAYLIWPLKGAASMRDSADLIVFAAWRWAFPLVQVVLTGIGKCARETGTGPEL